MNLQFFLRVRAGVSRRLRAKFEIYQINKAKKLATTNGQQLRNNNQLDCNWHSDVVALPLSQISDGVDSNVHYEGGLIDPDHGRLIPSANHYGGRGFIQRNPSSLPPSSSIQVIDRPTMFAGLCYTQFGHFIVESIGRLWNYRQMSSCDPFLVYLLPRRLPSSLGGQSFIFDILKGFQIPLDRILFVDKPMRFRKIVIPEQRYGFGMMHSPAPDFIDFLRTFKFDQRVRGHQTKTDRLYVSRTKFRGRGAMIGETILEAYLRKNDYQIIFPERLSLSEQLTLYQNAKQIIFADGSAALACVLLPDLRAEVAIIARRRDRDLDCQTLVDCMSGFGNPPVWIDHVVRQYQFGMPSWDALAEVDWHAVSIDLATYGFTADTMSSTDTNLTDDLISEALRDYVDQVSHTERFVEYLRAQGQSVRDWAPNPHLIDPRSNTTVDS